nr:HNH endonuclease [Brevibacterium permense]
MRCHWCKKRIRTFKDATVEHIKRRKDGGDVLDLRNLAIACSNCNYSQVGARNPVVFVDGRRFFDTESAEHPAPRVYPSPDRSEKTQ